MRRGPPDARAPGPGSPGDSPTPSTPIKGGAEDTSGVTQPVVIERCSAQTACTEVVARLEAGHRVKYIEQCPEHGEELIAQARRIANVHRQENELRDAG